MENKITIGILYPGHSAEDDYPTAEEMLGGDVKLPLVHTELHSDAHTPEDMKALGEPEALAEGARQLLANNKLDSIIWACTSGSFTYGWEGAHKQVDDLSKAANVPASSTSLAFVDALKHLNLTKVAIAATYPEPLANLFKTFLGDAAIEVVRIESRGITTASEVGATMGRDEVIKFVSDNDHPEAQAILVPDTALHSIAWLDDLEKAVNKPVLTANQVSIWQGIRLAEGNTVRPGWGSLFSK